MKNYNYITILSNWLIGYQKYSNTYSKEKINLSTYPNMFYLLLENEISIGLDKVTKLISKTNIENNKIIRIETSVEDAEIFKNTKNGLGWYINKNYIVVKKVYVFENNMWVESKIEDLNALSYLLKGEQLKKYDELIPRSLSVLPVAIACQAKCKFCFSESSISYDHKREWIDEDRLHKICKRAKSKGATRFVITGGGEPGILKFDNLIKIIKTAKIYFEKIVLITNGMFLSSLDKELGIEKIFLLENAGLTVLSISYHHYDMDKNQKIMGVDTKVDNLLKTINSVNLSSLKSRLVCVLQKEGVSSIEEIENYLDYAIEKNVDQVCFKELYISSTEESLYAMNKENIYSLNNQISLSLLQEFATERKLSKISELPWGSPIYKYKTNKGAVDFALYTEPSVGWEKSNGIARSWNVLSNGKCYASLEDKKSEIII